MIIREYIFIKTHLGNKGVKPTQKKQKKMKKKYRFFFFWKGSIIFVLFFLHRKGSRMFCYSRSSLPKGCLMWGFCHSLKGEGKTSFFVFLSELKKTWFWTLTKRRKKRFCDRLEHHLVKIVRSLCRGVYSYHLFFSFPDTWIFTIFSLLGFRGIFIQLKIHYHKFSWTNINT